MKSKIKTKNMNLLRKLYSLSRNRFNQGRFGEVSIGGSARWENCQLGDFNLSDNLGIIFILIHFYLMNATNWHLSPNWHFHKLALPPIRTFCIFCAIENLNLLTAGLLVQMTNFLNKLQTLSFEKNFCLSFEIHSTDPTFPDE